MRRAALRGASHVVPDDDATLRSTGVSSNRPAPHAQPRTVVRRHPTRNAVHGSSRHQRNRSAPGSSAPARAVRVSKSRHRARERGKKVRPVSRFDPQPLRTVVMRSPGAGMNLNDSVYDRLLRERIIFLGQPVDDAIANQICAQLLLLAAEDATRDVNLYINSPGGSVTAGMAIFDTMELVECDVATWAMGLAASMGQFLLSAGSEGQALRAAARAHPDAPGIGRPRWHGVRHQDPGRAVEPDQAGDGRDNRLAHRPDRRADHRRTVTATAGSPPRRRWSTGSSTTSSAGPARFRAAWRPQSDRAGPRESLR